VSADRAREAVARTFRDERATVLATRGTALVVAIAGEAA
jgi:hypothetical protein